MELYCGFESPPIPSTMTDDTYWRKKNDDLKTKKIIGIIVFAVLLVISFSLLGFSFKQINYNQYGLKQNIITKEIDNEVYEE